MDAVDTVGTRSAPLTIVVTKCLPDSASSHVMHEADNEYQMLVVVVPTQCTKPKIPVDLPGANATQVVEENSLFSLRMYVSNAAVPPPKEWPTI